MGVARLMLRGCCPLVPRNLLPVLCGGGARPWLTRSCSPGHITASDLETGPWQGSGVVGSWRFLDGVGVGVGILRVLGVGVGVGVGIFDPTPTPLSPIELIFNMLCPFIFTSPANLTFDLAWWC